MKNHTFLTGDIRASKPVIFRKQISVYSKAYVVVTVENSGSILQA